MHLYSGLHSFFKVHLTSVGCYSGCFHLDESTSNLLQAKQLSAPIHNTCCIPISITLYPLLVESFSLPFLLCLAKFSCPFLVCEADFLISLSLCPALPGPLLSPSLGWLGQFLSRTLVFLSPNGCVQNSSEANLSQKARPLSNPAFIMEYLGGDNIQRRM